MMLRLGYFALGSVLGGLAGFFLSPLALFWVTLPVLAPLEAPQVPQNLPLPLPEHKEACI